MVFDFKKLKLEMMLRKPKGSMQVEILGLDEQSYQTGIRSQSTYTIASMFYFQNSSLIKCCRNWPSLPLQAYSKAILTLQLLWPSHFSPKSPAAIVFAHTTFSVWKCFPLFFSYLSCTYPSEVNLMIIWLNKPSHFQVIMLFHVFIESNGPQDFIFLIKLHVCVYARVCLPFSPTRQQLQ